MAGKLFSLRGAALLALSLMAASAQAVDVTVAYQTSAEPAKVAQAENSVAKQSGAKVDWRKFDSGSSVLRALASGDVQIGNIGSSPLAVAASQKLPIEVFLIASQLGSVGGGLAAAVGPGLASGPLNTCRCGRHTCRREAQQDQRPDVG